jgi:hypothetical protein
MLSHKHDWASADVIWRGSFPLAQLDRRLHPQPIYGPRKVGGRVMLVKSLPSVAFGLFLIGLTTVLIALYAGVLFPDTWPR